jgi:hypothetical protein
MKEIMLHALWSIPALLCCVLAFAFLVTDDVAGWPKFLGISAFTWGATVCIMMLLSACSPLTAPLSVTRDARHFPPPSSYAAMWDSLKACSGLRGDLGRVSFYVVDSLPDRAVGRTVGHSVYLVDIMVDNPLVVRHEMMHALLQRNGHPLKYFHGVCGDLLGES